MSVTHVWISRWQGRETSAITYAGQTLSYSDLERRIRRAATWLRLRGCVSGETLALQIERSPCFLEIHLAALALGIVTLPLNPRYTDREVSEILGDAKVDHAILLDTPTRRIADEMAACSEDPLEAVPSLEETGVLCYTSGTTGRPKGAQIRQRNLLATVEALHEAWRWTDDDILIHALPLFHIHGLFVAQHVALMACAHTVWLPSFSVEDVWDAIAHHRATVFMGVPTFYNRWVASDIAPASLDHMRLFTSGSAPLSAQTWRRFRDRFGHEILERYGMTEIGIVLSNPYDGPRIPGTVGLPLPGVEAEVRQGDELWIRGPSVFSGYLNRPKATQEALQQGWMRTGDFATTLDSGHVRLLGRRSDLILTGGFNVYPGEVEAILLEHAGVQEAVVFGIGDPDLGACVHAAVVGDASPDDLLHWCRERLTGYKCPRHVWSRVHLPRNAMGKVLRKTLSAEYGLGPRWPDETRTALVRTITDPTHTARPIAAFDFDDTCIRGDIGVALLERFNAQGERDLVSEYEADCAVDTRAAYAKLTATLLAGRTPEEVQTETGEALDDAIQDGRIQWVPEIRKLLALLASNNWEIWVVTASPEVVVQVVAARLGLDPTQVIGMQVALDGEHFGANILPPITYREGKLEALLARCGRPPTLAMGDSPSDEALLHAAEIGILVDRGDGELRARALTAGWHVVGGW
jgi:malonyl-CoA/methylmalonyl-CoA synthetase